MSFHLTHTGPYAGMTLCGGPHTPNDQHPSYSPGGLARQLANCCPDCARIWNEAGTEDDEASPSHPFVTRPTKYAWKCLTCGLAMTEGNHTFDEVQS